MGVETRAPAILIGNLIPFLTATIFTSGRVFARAFLLGQFGWDDATLLFGWLFALGNCIEACLATVHGAGKHVVDVQPAQAEPARKLAFGTLLLYQASLCLTKLAIVLFYLRVFGTNKTAKTHLWILFLFILLYTVPLEVVSVLSCIPTWKFWRPDTPGYCLDTRIAFWTSFACNLLTDIWIILFAVPRVWKLKLQLTQKVALSITLSLGWLVVVAAIIRVVRISAILDSQDTTWDSYDTSIWSAVEVNVSIICAAAPALKPIFMRFAPGFLYSLSGASFQKPSSNFTPGRSSRWKAWSCFGNNENNGAACFEMSGSGIKRSHMTSRSQENLSRSVGRSTWVSGHSTPSDDGHVGMDEIWKSTEVRIVRDGSPARVV